MPTSFVPHPAAAPGGPRRFKTDYAGAFGFFGYAVLAVVFALAIGVFFYGRILATTQAAKDAELAQQIAAIDPATITGFVRLRDRLVSGKQLLTNHIAFSNFLTALGLIVPTTVRLSSLHVSVDTEGTPKIQGNGVAKSFNALAAASTAFATDGRIKDVIFSNITINSKDNSVAFALSAELDPKLIAFMP